MVDGRFVSRECRAPTLVPITVIHAFCSFVAILSGSSIGVTAATNRPSKLSSDCHEGALDKPFFVLLLYSSLISDSFRELSLVCAPFVSTIAGKIPREIGQIATLVALALDGNMLLGKTSYAQAQTFRTVDVLVSSLLRLFSEWNLPGFAN